ncbi:uncharacterized protein LOC120534088 isoform X1 [Polypterus senegalus]|uniref:uncharacterized protein LOC120534088 isoform X1 n=1 Tax=Polypterus senegalus TaxID=55291 RepID=UPI001963DB88|nr:uncharacterized protein LOC120534088 isoform X1 [Polypterus senegalus]
MNTQEKGKAQEDAFQRLTKRSNGDESTCKNQWGSTAVPESNLEPIYERDKENLENEDENQSGPVSEEEIPLYVQFLYSHLGKDRAEDFLHPTIVQHDASAKVKQMYKLFEGTMDSEEIWNMLRTESKFRLIDLDFTFSRQLKAAYDSYIRDMMIRKKLNVQISDMENSSTNKVNILQRIRKEYLKQLALMYMASELNQEKSQLILANNPLSELNDLENCSPIKYLSDTSLLKQQESSRRTCVFPPLICYKKQPPIITNYTCLKKSMDSKSHKNLNSRLQAHPVPSTHLPQILPARALLPVKEAALRSDISNFY